MKCILENNGVEKEEVKDKIISSIIFRAETICQDIIKYENKWYWYGEHKGAPNCKNKQRVDFIGISCYSSDNLLDWHYEGLVLEAAAVGSGSMLEPQNVIERPKVVYNKKRNSS